MSTPSHIENVKFCPVVRPRRVCLTPFGNPVFSYLVRSSEPAPACATNLEALPFTNTPLQVTPLVHSASVVQPAFARARLFAPNPPMYDSKPPLTTMYTFGLVSSVVDYLTFGVLLLVLHAGPAEFRTGWFVESVVSATMIVIADAWQPAAESTVHRADGDDGDNRAGGASDSVHAARHRATVASWGDQSHGAVRTVRPHMSDRDNVHDT